ncbi:ROK family protein [Pontibacter sp. SGAir0037]|uniref:ROK family protein n=1 Tax=Pontibacter sp. SGAir0037 TaxID=2571030 RepID=UPI0010CCFBB1|nr:ROK family protein [Pontibacter sp. SGAir0037]QCR21158.1 hypothetical protein C1N53_01510 [Pontibacter sp. SGAir0037]
MRDSTVLGIDIGGSHITAALVNLNTYSLLEESCERKEINTGGKAADIINDWCEVIRKVIENNASFCGKIGIAMPGPFDYKAGISLINGQNKYDALYKLNVKELLSEKLAISSENISFSNDAESFLQGEVVCGIARGYKKVLGLTLGTGLGSAKSDDGIVEDADLWNTPFKDGIAEDYLSTRWFLRRSTELTGKHFAGVKEISEAVTVSPALQQVFAEFGENMGAFLTLFIQRENPELVVLGGNISKAHSLFFPAMESYLTQAGIFVPIRIAELGEEAPLVGAASSWIRNKVLSS